MRIFLDLDPHKVMREKYDPRFQQAQKFLDSEVLRCSGPYIPWLEGHLTRSGQTGTKIGSGQVVWNAPYAKYQYYGLSFHHSTFHNPQASAQWFEKAKAVHKDAWTQGVQKIIGG